MEALDSLQVSIQKAIEGQVADIKKQYVADVNSHQAAFDKEKKEYEAEIQKLKEDISQLQGHKQKRRLHEENEADSSKVSLEAYNAVKAELENCKNDFRRVHHSRNLLHTQNRYLKDSLRQWQAYSGRRSLDHSDVGSRPTSMSGSHSLHSSPTNAGPQRTDAESAAETVDESDGDAVTAGCNKAENQERHTSPQSHIKQEMEVGGSSPIIISERSLKRKKGDKSTKMHVNIHEDRSTSKGTGQEGGVKHENSPSSPLRPSKDTNHLRNLTESLDLDEVGGTLYTPRKRQRLEQMMKSSLVLPVPEAASDRCAIIDEASQTDEAHELARFEDKNSRLDENFELQLDETDNEAMASKLARKRDQRAQQDAHNERVHARLMGKSSRVASPPEAPKDLHPQCSKDRDIYDVPSSSPQDDRALLPRTNTISTSKKQQCPPSHRDHGAKAISTVAEDGEYATPSRPSLNWDEGSRRAMIEECGGSRRPPKDTDAYQRLDKLLKDPSPPKPLILDNEVLKSHKGPSASIITAPHPSDRANVAAYRTPWSLPPPKRHSTPINRSTKSTTPLPSKRGRLSPVRPHSRKPSPSTEASSNDPPESLPEHEPLRVRPLSVLNLQDFKLNPKHSNYAYHETIRKHDDKKSRGGCTDPFCQRCKDLAKVAELTAIPLSPTSETKLLREYMGRDAHRLPTLSKEERAVYLKAARTKDFKHKFGKHRRSFSKPPEPPGFWDVGFPSTQEEEVRREECRVLERKKVEERWEEARRGGMWVFADEM